MLLLQFFASRPAWLRFALACYSAFMSTQPNCFAALAASKASSLDVSMLFQQLADRSVVLARMQDEFLAQIIRHREARTGKPFRYTKRQQGLLGEFNNDAEKAMQDMKQLISKMDDKSLLTSALSCEYQEYQMDENMVSSYRPEDRENAGDIINFRQETIRLIEQFIETSPYKGLVDAKWYGKKQKKTG